MSSAQAIAIFEYDIIVGFPWLRCFTAYATARRWAFQAFAVSRVEAIGSPTDHVIALRSKVM